MLPARAPGRRPQAAAGVVLIAVLFVIASAIYIVSLPRVGQLPNNDYYWVLSQISTDRGPSFAPSRWLSLKSNEHTVLLPAVAYLLNVWLTGGDNRALSFFSLVLLAIEFAVLFRLLVRQRQWPLAAQAVAGLALAVLVLAPTTAHNFVMGFSGAIWFLANVFAVGAAAALVRHADGAPLWPALLLGVCGGLSYSTGLSIFPGLLLGAWLLGLPKRDLVGLGAAGCLVVGYSVAFLHPVSGHPVPGATGAWVILDYFGRYVGAPFSYDRLTTALLGWGGIVSSLFVCTALIRSPEAGRRTVAPWVALQVMVLLNALFTAVCRSGLSEGPGVSRYASVPALFWASFAAMIFLLWDRHRPALSTSPWMYALAGLLVLGCAAPMYRRGLMTLRDLLDRASYQPAAAQALLLGIHDDEMLRNVTQYPEEIWSVYGFLKSVRHVPFRSRQVLGGGDAALPLEEHPGVVLGYLERVRSIDPRHARADGWAFAPDDPVAEVVLLNSAGRIQGRASLGLERPDVSRVVGRRARASGWSAYVESGGDTSELRAYARMAHGRVFYRLQPWSPGTGPRASD